MLTENIEKFNSLQFIGVVNANEHIHSAINLGIWHLGCRYLSDLYLWRDVDDCRYALEEMKDRPHPYWIVCVGKEECETSDVIALLYEKYASSILVIDCRKNDLHRRWWIDYVRAGAVGCITDKQVKQFTSILRLLEQGYGVLEKNYHLIDCHESSLQRLYPTMRVNLDFLEAQIAELLLNKELIADLDAVTIDYFATMEKLLMQRLRINKLDDILLDIVEMRWCEKRRAKE